MAVQYFIFSYYSKTEASGFTYDICFNSGFSKGISFIHLKISVYLPINFQGSHLIGTQLINPKLPTICCDLYAYSRTSELSKVSVLQGCPSYRGNFQQESSSSLGPLYDMDSRIQGFKYIFLNNNNNNNKRINILQQRE